MSTSADGQAAAAAASGGGGGQSTDKGGRKDSAGWRQSCPRPPTLAWCPPTPIAGGSERPLPSFSAGGCTCRFAHLLPLSPYTPTAALYYSAVSREYTCTAAEGDCTAAGISRFLGVLCTSVKSMLVRLYTEDEPSEIRWYRRGQCKKKLFVD